MTTVISVEHLSKQYRLGLIGGSTLHDDLDRWWARVRSQPDPALKIGHTGVSDRIGDRIWALQDVSFQVQQGEVLGIIGRNGAGKSTLLKIMSRVTAPTSGMVKVKGRIASLLEVGTGFHPELTGRENIYLNGAILGMHKAEIAGRFDEIVAFAEIEQFLDTPVKRYSSGMYVRLAFAVAAHLEPEILLVDEVLAVGDTAFQKKCLGKMGAVAKEGRTVIFVSHSMGAITALCEKAILLERGELHGEGDASTMVSSYLNAGSSTTGQVVWSDITSAPGNDRARLRAVRMRDKEERITATLDVSEAFVIEIEYCILKPLSGVRVGFQIMTADGIMVCSGLDWDDPAWKDCNRPVGDYVSRCVVPPLFLNRLTYSLRVAMDIPAREILFLEERLLTFDVLDSQGVTGRWSMPPLGVVFRPFEWKVVRQV